MRFVARLATGLGLAAVCGCSFVLGFPTDLEAIGGSGSAGGAGGAGGGGGACSVPSLRRIAWQARPDTSLDPESEFDMTLVTGLVRLDGRTVAYGMNDGGIFGLTFPSPQNNLVFLASVPDDSVFSEPLGSVLGCDADANITVTSRAAPVGGDVIVSGYLGIGPTGTNGYGFGAGRVDGCATPLPVVGQAGAATPFFAVFSGSGASPSPDPYMGARGAALDIDFQAGVFGGIGAAIGLVEGVDSGAAYPRYFLVRSTTTSGNEVAFVANAAPGDTFPSEVPGAAAVDAQGTVWGTGVSCADPQCGAGGDVFVARWPAGMAPIPVDSGGTGTSTGTAVASGGGRVFVGGAYTNELQIGGGPVLPTATDPSSFVVALDGAGQALWSYPAVGDMTFAGFDSVVDLAYAPGTCPNGSSGGFVYVAGCLLDPSAPLTNNPCRIPTAGEHGYVAKLDAETGRPLWLEVLQPVAAATDVLLPTAITADETGLWVALAFRGQTTLPGVLATGPGQHGLLLEYTP